MKDKIRNKIEETVRGSSFEERMISIEVTPKDVRGSDYDKRPYCFNYGYCFFVGNKKKGKSITLTFNYHLKPRYKYQKQKPAGE